MATVQSVPPWRVWTFSDAVTAADVARDRRRVVDEFAGARNDRDGADLLLEGIDRRKTSNDSCGMRLPKRASASRSKTT